MYISMKLHDTSFHNGTSLPLHAPHLHDTLMTPSSYFMRLAELCIHHTPMLVHNVSYTVVPQSHKFIIFRVLVSSAINRDKFRGSNDTPLTSALHQIALKLPTGLCLWTLAFTCCLHFYHYYRQANKMKHKWAIHFRLWTKKTARFTNTFFEWKTPPKRSIISA